MNAATMTNRQIVLAQWNQKAIAAKEAIAAEREIRAAVIEAYNDAKAFPPESYSGVESIDIGEGFDLKIEHALDWKLDSADDSARTKAALTAIENSGEGGGIIAERLVKWKPEISVREYKMLTPAQRAIIDKVLTIKPASKSIKIHKRGI